MINNAMTYWAKHLKISATIRLVVRIPIWSTFSRNMAKSITGTQSTAMILVKLKKANCFITLEDQPFNKFITTVKKLQRQ
jgi:hypothetical protein